MPCWAVLGGGTNGGPKRKTVDVVSFRPTSDGLERNVSIEFDGADGHVAPNRAMHPAVEGIGGDDGCCC